MPPVNTSVHFPNGYVNNATSSYYGACKFLQIQHAKELAEREKENNVLAFSLHPGSVLTSWHPKASTWEKICTIEYPQLPPNKCPYTPPEGVAVFAYVGLHPDAVSGAYYSRVTGCTQNPPTMHGFTAAMLPELYAKSQAWVGIKYDL
jgi:NAD(P)-dependent dehydrogenase (short-subunit alcohol dehydrogenase family)